MAPGRQRADARTGCLDHRATDFGLRIDSFGAAVLGAFLIAVLSVALSLVLERAVTRGDHSPSTREGSTPADNAPR